MEFHARRAEKYISPNQPGRVLLSKISWHHRNCGGQGILPSNGQHVAFEICEKGNSKRRHKEVILVEVPEDRVTDWLAANKEKAKMNPLLADFAAMSHTGPYYASLNGTHFVEAQKLIMEGNRRFRDHPSGTPFVLKEGDEEGRLIQELGVLAVVYTAGLWNDDSAIRSVMREGDVYHEP